ncbi:hypothetical protein EXIGLDRAFT_730450 [Exidia glandulosa HHB12029]|uniref:Uncharacterized protein n=1 Tax=Exidia glandulosa HHB12029 TaxID=1314781 RepID=A0A165L8P0_EXIGL|nr:hypothetical protein EXIGLDRAFT_730450 [Exidia glandulosa HHB12029]
MSSPLASTSAKPDTSPPVAPPSLPPRAPAMSTRIIEPDTEPTPSMATGTDSMVSSMEHEYANDKPSHRRTASASSGRGVGERIRGSFGVVHGAGEILRGSVQNAIDSFGDSVAGQGEFQNGLDKLRGVPPRHPPSA